MNEHVKVCKEACARVLDDLRGGELLRLHAGVELGVLNADPLLRDDGDDVVAAYHLLALAPQVVDPQLYVRHACVQGERQSLGSGSTALEREEEDGDIPLRKPRKNRRTRAICFSTEPSASCSTYSSSTAVTCT